ncbi:hypothetical protein [Streptomyces sp. NPDC004266]|uniref:hypothetical protein n=1 Tax=Streptomyces sp. NPDC004266 TaxID=3364693 RepID=UPI00369AFDC6
MHLIRIARRRERLRSTDSKHLLEVRKRVAEAVKAGISLEEAAKTTGYKLETITRWLSKQKDQARDVPTDKAKHRLELINQRRHRVTRRDLAISKQAQALVRKAMGAGIQADEFASLSGYTESRVTKWFASVRRALQQAQRQRELIATRRGKGSRPPQHLTEAEYDQWLVEADHKRRKVLRRYGLSQQLPKPNHGSSRRGRGRKRHQTAPRVRPKLLAKGSGRRKKRPRK